MDDSFDRLEQKVRDAAERIRQLRGDKERLSGEAEIARADLDEAKARIAALEGEQKAATEREAESEDLRAELEQARNRIAELEESPPVAADDDAGDDEARVTELEAGGAESFEDGVVEELKQTVSRLRDERREIKKRVEKLVKVLDSL